METEAIRDAYDDLINQDERVELKGKTMHYTSLNGNMFSFVSKDGEVGFRMSKEDRTFMLAEYGAGALIQHNKVMREYVHVPNEFVMQPELMRSFLDKSWIHANTLKAKPTKKSK